VSYCLLVLWQFDLSVETFVAVLDYVSAYSVSASFWKLLPVPKWMFKYVRLNLCIICFCNHLVRLLERTVPFLDPFLTLCLYFHTVLFCFGFIVWEPTHFPFVGSFTLSFFWIMSENDRLMSSPFLIQLGKKKKSFVVVIDTKIY
jgi:hypothetical protein